MRIRAGDGADVATVVFVHWYEEQGFVATAAFAVGDWQGQLFELRMAA